MYINVHAFCWCVQSLWNVTQELNVFEPEHWGRVADKVLMEFQMEIYKAVHVGRAACFVGGLLCLTSQQHACVFHGGLFLGTSCHTEEHV